MIRLFDEDSYINEFEAVVEGCEKTDDGYKVMLDRTAFFPTAGGQECDSGVINGEKVLSVLEEGELVFHILRRPLELGTKVRCAIDWQERFEKMQHHSAEHIISGIVTEKFGYENVGFHLGEDVTIDYNGELSGEDIACIERLSNEAVQKNLKITAWYPKGSQLGKINYRSKMEIEGRVRIVEIEGIDVCACCAPHVKRTGEIGVIKIVDSMRHRGGTRLRMICGMKAYKDYLAKSKSCEKISVMLSERQDSVACGVKRVMEEVDLLKGKNAALKRELLKLRAEKLVFKEGNLCIFEDDLEKGDMMNYAKEFRKKCGGSLVLCVGNDTDGYNYIIMGDNISSGGINAALSGRGGGRDGVYQGHFNSRRCEIERYFK